jgi:cytochrome c peroxidase
MRCATCHIENKAFTDGRATALGLEIGSLNTPTIFNRALSRRQFFDQRAFDLIEQSLGPVINPKEMNGNISKIINAIKTSSEFAEIKNRINQIFPNEEINKNHIAYSLTAFMLSKISNYSRADKILDDKTNQKHNLVLQGKFIFDHKGRCIACHSGPNFTDEIMHDTGVSATPNSFKTPTLWNISKTAPYFHDGKTGDTGSVDERLRAVIDFYSEGFVAKRTLYRTMDPELRPLALSDKEKDALVAYLKELVPNSPTATSINNVFINEKTYSITSVSSNNVLENWPTSNVNDGNENTAYSSNSSPSSTNINNIYLVARIDSPPASPKTVSAIFLRARMLNLNGVPVPMGFPAQYQIYLTSPNNSKWDLLGTFENQPDSNGKVIINLATQRSTYGVMIIPTQLGKDNYGVYYFQMAEIAVGESSAPNPFVPTSLNTVFKGQFVYPIVSVTSNNVLTHNVDLNHWAAANAGDNNVNTSYSSNSNGSSTSTTNTMNANLTAWIPHGPQDKPKNISAIFMKARMLNLNGVPMPMGFPAQYQIHLRSSDNSKWNLIGTFNTQPDSSGLAIIKLGVTYSSYGIKITPTQLGKDNYGYYYFQMAEIAFGEKQ